MWKELLTAVAFVGLIPAATAADDSSIDIAALQAKDPSRSIQHLYEQCTGTNVYERTYCAGYITATVDNMYILGGVESAHAFAICPPVQVSYKAAMQVFANWAQKHPETWSLHRHIGLVWALKDIWPCK